MPSHAAQEEERLPSGVEIVAAFDPLARAILTPPALEFLAALHRCFESERRRRLAPRCVPSATEVVVRVDMRSSADYRNLLTADTHE